MQENCLGNEIAKLERYYRDQGIHPLDFRCEFHSICSDGCENFTEAKSSLIGSNYGARGLPRLVVLSADPGRGWSEPAARTLESIRSRHDSLDLETAPKNNHWYQTHELVASILSEFGSDMDAESAAGHFAHVNAAKCSQNKHGKKQADSKLFRNCRRYLRGELAILKPDIIVSQGGAAGNALDRTVDGIQTHKFEECAIVRFGQREAFWLRLHHPKAWGGVYQVQKQKWPLFNSLIRAWIR